MLNRKNDLRLKITSILLSLVIFTQCFWVVADTNETTNPAPLIGEILTVATYSQEMFNKYEDYSFELNEAEIIEYDEFGRVSYTYGFENDLSEEDLPIELFFHHNMTDLGDKPYNAQIIDGSENFTALAGGVNFLNSVYGFGIGWGLNLPQIEYINENFSYLHLGDGTAYRIYRTNSETTEYALYNYPYSLTIVPNTVNDEELNTSYVDGFIAEDRFGNKYYFNEDGRFIKQTDKTDTLICAATYDENKLISSYSYDVYTVSFIKTEVNAGTNVVVSIARGTETDHPAILTIQNNRLANIIVNEESESSYTADEETITVTSSTDSRTTVAFTYSEVSNAILKDSETSQLTSSITGFKSLLISRVYTNAEYETEYSYAAVDSTDTEAVEKAQLYNDTAYSYIDNKIKSFDLTYGKAYVNIGEQGSKRYSRVEKIGYSIANTFNEGYDPANAENTSSTVTAPETEIFTDNVWHDFAYNSDNKVVSDICYFEEETEISENSTWYDYSIDTELASSITANTGENAKHSCATYYATYSKDENDEWILNEDSIELAGKTVVNASGDVIYDSAPEEDTIFYGYNNEGSAIKEVVVGGLTYQNVYDEYQVLTQTIFDVYLVSYNENGDITNVTQDGEPYMTMTYDEDYNLASEEFANGDKLFYEYDSDGDVTDVYEISKTDDNKLYHYEYITLAESNSEVVESIEAQFDIDSDKQIKTLYDYSQNRVSRYTYSTDESGNRITTENVYSINADDTETLLYSNTKSNDSTSLTYDSKTIETEYTSSPIYTTNEDGEQVETGTTDIATIDVDGVMWYNKTTKDTSGEELSRQVYGGENILNYLSAYTYNDKGLVSYQSDNYGYNKTYSYDADNLLTGINYAYNGGSFNEFYVYDNNGDIFASGRENLVTYNYEINSSGNMVVRDTNYSNVVSYVYGGVGYNENELKSIWYPNGTGQTLFYDEIGNLTSYNGYTYTWDMGRRLTGMYNETNAYFYKYNSEGLRTSKLVNGEATNFIYQDDQLKAQYTDSYSMEFWYDKSNSPAGFIYTDKTEENPTPEIYIYQKNILGDIVGIIDENGVNCGEYYYDAWGYPMEAYVPANEVFYLNPFRYRGYYYDTETGYYYLQSRYYNPEWGRFINADEIYRVLRGDTQTSINQFLYCMGNPIAYVDYSGKAWKTVAGLRKYAKAKKNKASDLKDYLNSPVNVKIFSASFEKQEIIEKDEYGRPTKYKIESFIFDLTEGVEEQIKSIFPNSYVSIDFVASTTEFEECWEEMRTDEIKFDMVFICAHGNDGRIRLGGNYQEKPDDKVIRLYSSQVAGFKKIKSIDYLLMFSCHGADAGQENGSKTHSMVRAFANKIGGIAIGSRDKVNADLTTEPFKVRSEKGWRMHYYKNVKKNKKSNKKITKHFRKRILTKGKEYKWTNLLSSVIYTDYTKEHVVF